MVKIKNRQELLNNAFSSNNRKARKIVLDVIEALLDEVEPKKIVKSQIQLTNETLIVGEKSFALSSFNNILIVGGGKASGFMAEALEEILGDRIKHGIIVVPKGTSGK
jgi:glycerate-2-kinase